ncbi:MAG: PepSY domain-containing protein, partial [Alphaproteobacteria bacterium]|nr:PepSY domain-containing protein [Alphaproteobacteria bacterium]
MTASFLPRKWHKWLFLVIGAQMFLWALSGLYMVTVSIDYIHGDHLVKGVKPRISMPSAYPVKITDLIRNFPAATEIRTGRLLGKPVYEIKTPNNSYLVDARSGAKLPPLTKSTIQSVAQALYAGPGAISSLRLLTEKPPSEIRGRPLPLWQVTFNDSSSPTLYISPSTGRLIAKRHDYWRIFDFLWMLHVMDYDNRSDVNNWLLRFSTLAVALAALSGIWLLFYSFSSKKPQPSRSNSPPATRRMQILRPFHKWLGLIIGLQVVLWAVSGLVMALLDSSSVQGIDRAGASPPQTIISGSTIPGIKAVAALNITNGFYQLSLHRLDNRLIYQISDQNGRRLVDARSGQTVIIGADTARSIAAKDYVGPGTIVSAQTVMMPTSDTANARGPAWKIDFNDSRRTTLYISGETGRLIVRRNNIWR